jgi:hypothetical protein
LAVTAMFAVTAPLLGCAGNGVAGIERSPAATPSQIVPDPKSHSLLYAASGFNVDVFS